MAWVAKIQPISVPENCRNRERYNASSGSHDPQMTYSRNIIRLRRHRALSGMATSEAESPPGRTSYVGGGALDRPSRRPLSSLPLTRGLSIAVAACVLAASTAAASDRKRDGAPSEATLELYRSKCQQCHLADGNSPLAPLNF